MWPWTRRENDGWRDVFVSMAVLVKSIRAIHPGWKELKITRNKEGGVTLIVDGVRK